MTKFERLSHFVGNLIDTPEVKNQQYHQGLSWALQRLTLSHWNQPFKALVGLATSQKNITKRQSKIGMELGHHRGLFNPSRGKDKERCHNMVLKERNVSGTEQVNLRIFSLSRKIGRAHV